jgi:hypothetical protein
MKDDEITELTSDVDHMLAEFMVEYDLSGLQLSAVVLARLHLLNYGLDDYANFLMMLKHAETNNLDTILVEEEKKTRFTVIDGGRSLRDKEEKDD